MITSQDIRAKSFEKAVFGGYDMAAVDQYLEAVAQEMDTRMKEVSTLKSKMKILANKVEEYRSTEDAMRLALVSAQQLATQIEAEARAKGEAIIADATAQSVEYLASLQNETAAEVAKLEAAKASLAEFLTEARAMCETQLRFLNELPNELYGEVMPETEEIIDEEAEELNAIIEEFAEIPDLMDEPELMIEEPAQETDDFAATLMFSLD